MVSDESTLSQSQWWGIAEWYGKRPDAMAPEERRRLAEIASSRSRASRAACPFRNGEPCKKQGGVCTLARYHGTLDGSGHALASISYDAVATVCPERFKEQALIWRWVGETLLDCTAPLVVTEVDFLRHSAPPAGAASGAQDTSERGVGRIDTALVDPLHTDALRWCALQAQAVYFSGASMEREFARIRDYATDGIPFPVGRRRPDWRSSGPKRLMPQLQIKVPTLRRWGKKTAVVVDRAFFASMAPMATVADISNCDIAWFVVRYDQDATSLVLRPDAVYLTTLEHAVEGLTAGVPVSQSEFEARLRAKLPAIAWPAHRDSPGGVLHP